MSQQNSAPGQTPSGSTRRDFLKRATAAATVAGAATSLVGCASASGGGVKSSLKSGVAPYAGRVIGANDKIVCGFVGVGGQGYGAHVSICKDVDEQAHNIALAAVADVSKHRVEVAKKKAGPQCEGYEDYRRMLERKDIDVIFCATVDHWHTRISVDSMTAGKHVYVEKPMTRYLSEGFQMYDVAKSTGKLVQVGSQGCSDKKWHKAAEWIRAGKIGPVVMSQGSYMRNNPKGEWNYTIQKWCTPEDLNWAAWMGDQIKKQVPFNPDHYFRWRKYQPYCSGLLGDLFPHKLHPYMLATGNPEFPVRVASVGNKKVQSDLQSSGDAKTEYVRDVPEIVQLIAEFPSGMVMHITSSTVNEQGTQEMIRGHKATLTMAGNKVELKPERPFAEDIDPVTSEAFTGENAESVANHHRNFFRAIRGQEAQNAGIDLAVKVQTVISLAEMSERFGVMCYFDAATRKVKDGLGREIPALDYGTTPLS
jgi:predicted dehydrogenase